MLLSPSIIFILLSHPYHMQTEGPAREQDLSSCCETSFKIWTGKNT